jgi:uncharacterized protein YeaO (DUF488 family)
MPVAIKRAYEPAAEEDGYRVLVDGLWPRGLSKQRLRVDEWMADIAPSPELRQWYGHQEDRWPEFRRRYRQELGRPPRKALVDALVKRARAGRLTLVFGTRQGERSNAAVLAEVIRQKLKS